MDKVNSSRPHKGTNLIGSGRFHRKHEETGFQNNCNVYGNGRKRPTERSNLPKAPSVGLIGWGRPASAVTDGSGRLRRTQREDLRQLGGVPVQEPGGVSRTHWGTVLMCSEGTDEVVEVDESLETLRTFPVKSPCKAITLRQDNLKYILVAAKGENRVEKILESNKKSVETRRFTSEVWDICLIETKRVILATTENYQLYILSLDLDLLSFTHQPSSPRGLTVGQGDEILATSSYLRIVIVYKLTLNEVGKLSPKIIRFLSLEGEISQKIVAQRIHREKRDTSQNSWQGLCLDKNRNILIADSQDEAIQVLSYEGEYLGRILAANEVRGVLCGPGWILAAGTGNTSASLHRFMLH